MELQKRGQQTDMKRYRTIAGSPVRSASDAWDVFKNLLAETLERSSDVSEGSINSELAVLEGIGPALIAGGHLESDGLVLCDAGLHVTFTFAISDAATKVEENLNPIPGGASATKAWTLYIPLPGTLDSSVIAASEKSSHLSVENPPTSTPEAKSNGHKTSSTINLDAFRRGGS